MLFGNTELSKSVPLVLHRKQAKLCALKRKDCLITHGHNISSEIGLGKIHGCFLFLTPASPCGNTRAHGLLFFATSVSL